MAMNPPTLMPLTNLYLSTLSRVTTMQNFGLLAQKIYQVIAILVHDPPEKSVFVYLVKSYYHAKFWASSSKIDQIMAILSHDPPSYTPEPPTSDAPDHFVFEHLVKSYYHAKCRTSSLKIEGVRAIHGSRLPRLALIKQRRRKSICKLQK